VIKLASGEWFTGRVSSCALFFPAYSRAGPQKEKLRKKFVELCNEDTPMIRRACASKIGVILYSIKNIYRSLQLNWKRLILSKSFFLCLDSYHRTSRITSEFYALKVLFQWQNT
jgi:hypothetical protein